MQVNIESDLKHEIMNSEGAFLVLDPRKVLEKNKKWIFLCRSLCRFFEIWDPGPQETDVGKGKVVKLGSSIVVRNFGKQNHSSVNFDMATKGSYSR
jgi:hypothetical protein